MDKRKLLKGFLLVSMLACTVLLAIGSFVVTKSQPTPSPIDDSREMNWSFSEGEYQDNSQQEDADEAASSESEKASSDIIEGSDGTAYASNRVLLTFDGSTNEQELRSMLTNEGVDVKGISLVSKSLDNNEVLVAVDYLGDEDPQSLADRLADTSAVTSSEPDYVMYVDETYSQNETAAIESSYKGNLDSFDSEGTDDEEKDAIEEDTAESESEAGDVIEDDTSNPDQSEDLWIEGDFDDSSIVPDSDQMLLSDPLELSPDATTNDSYRSKQWALSASKFTKAWDYVKASGAVTVAVIDTGVDYDHSDLSGNLVSSTYFKNTYTGSTGNAAVDDQSGHGTHVAGIIAAQANNSKGTVGVSYNAKILPIKAAFKNSEGKWTFYSSDIIEGIDYAISLKSSSLKTIRIINMSLGGGDYSSNFQNAITRATNAGILCIATAGNNDSYYSAYYPAAYDGALAVSALKESTNSAGQTFDDGYSNYGPYVDISAPGTSIYSTIPSNTYGYKSGTSMAAPVVSGAAALVWAQNMNLKPAWVINILQQTATDLGTSGRDDKYGNGALNAYNAVYYRPIAYCSFSSVANQVYTGSAIKPKVTVKYGNTTLTEGTDYTLSYSNNINVGKATITITGKGRCTSSAKVYFNIRKQVNPTFNSSTVTYNEQPQYLKVSSTLPSGVSVSYSNNGKVNAGSYTVTAKFSVDTNTYLPISNKTATLTINPASILDCKNYRLAVQSYTGSPIKPKPVVLSPYGTTMTEGVDYTLAYADNVEVGQAWIRVTGKGNYEGTGYITFNIESGVWKKDSVGWWYERPDGTYPVSCWEMIDGKWYHFNSSGYMQTGWLNLGGKWRYLGSDGIMQTGWVWDGAWYYLDPANDGIMATGWIFVDDSWYYLYSSGIMARSCWIGDFYLLDDGRMATDQWIDGYYVGSDGKWIPGYEEP